MANKPVTIVTACDFNYLWGVFLLVASIHKEGLPVNVLFVQVGFDDDSELYIGQFPSVRIIRDDSDDPYSLNNRKAKAMLRADSDYIAWMDADCFIAGWIGELLKPLNGQLQVRMRLPAENATVFGRYYESGDKRGSIPKWVLDRWRQDVGDNSSPRYDTTCPSNCFVIHRRFMPFIELWDTQIRKVVASTTKGAVDRGNPAYWMTDESVLNSLLLFSSLAPEPSRYRLDNLDAGHVVHFIGSPKPWIGWTQRFLYCLPKVLDLIEWLDKEGFRIPPVPPSLSKDRVRVSRMEAHLRGAYGIARRVGGQVLSKVKWVR